MDAKEKVLGVENTPLAVGSALRDMLNSRSTSSLLQALRMGPGTYMVLAGPFSGQ